MSSQSHHFMWLQIITNQSSEICMACRQRFEPRAGILKAKDTRTSGNQGTRSVNKKLSTSSKSFLLLYALHCTEKHVFVWSADNFYFYMLFIPHLIQTKTKLYLLYYDHYIGLWLYGSQSTPCQAPYWIWWPCQKKAWCLGSSVNSGGEVVSRNFI